MRMNAISTLLKTEYLKFSTWSLQSGHNFNVCLLLEEYSSTEHDITTDYMHNDGEQNGGECCSKT